MGQHRKASLLGTGAVLGDRRVDSAALDDLYGFAPGTVLRKSGVETRYWCAKEDQISMAARASRRALSRANVAPEQLDAILHAAAVPYQAIPCTAPLVQRALGVVSGVEAFDVNATCLSFLAALGQASAMIESGRWQTVLIVSSERASRGLDWSCPSTAGLFGDGAGAVVLGSGRNRVETVVLETFPEGYEASALVAGGTRLDHEADPGAFEASRHFRMDGRALYRLTRARFEEFVAQVLARQGWQLADVDCIVPHQASPRALGQMGQALGVTDRLVDLSASHGNMIAASLPFALDHALGCGRIAPGARVLLLGTAAGVSFGAACLQL